ncbi:MAG: hypothetical protein AAF603_02760 [Pseudomonadota bacterium]
MIGNLSILKLSSAMARHAAHTHGVIGDNISRVDMPGATAHRVESFARALDALKGGEALNTHSTDQPISVSREMSQMATNAGRHGTAVTIWSKTLELVRLAGAAPR